MFLGGTGREILGHVTELINVSKCTRFFAPFAGNFFLEQMCRNTKMGNKLEVHSTDVSTYSNLIGFGITGKQHTIRLIEESEYLFDFIENKTPDDYAVISIIMSDLAITLQRAETTVFYKKMVEDYFANRKQYFDKCMKKYMSVKKRIMAGPFTYYGIDASEVLRLTKAGDFVYYDPPFNTGSYEEQFKAFSKHFIGNDVAYTDITPEVVTHQLKEQANKGCVVVYRGQSHFINEGIIKLPEGFEKIHTTKYKYNSEYLLYSNMVDAPRRVFNLIKVNEKVVNYPLIDEADKITPKSQIHIVKVEEAIANHYRLLWIKKAQVTSGAGVSYLVFIDKKLIGAVQFIEGRNFGLEVALLLSDPICPFSRYRRLSKLLVSLVASRPFVAMVSQDTLWYHSGVITRVTTNNPSSMKYRGNAWEKVKVDENDEGANYKFTITYKTKLLYPTYKAALAEWCQKHSNDIQKMTEHGTDE